MSGVGSAIIAVIVLIAVVGGSLAIVRRVRNRNEGSRSGPSARIDSFTVGEPWRRHVAAAQAAQRRYRAQVLALPAGPLKARMAEIGMQVDRGVMECWDIAKRGYQLDGVIRDLNAADLKARLDKSVDQREGASLRAQLGSVDRIRAARNDADERLRVLQTRLGELVGQAAEVVHDVPSTDNADTSDTSDTATTSPTSTNPGELGSAVDDVVTQLTALRLAIREVSEPMVGLDGADGGTAASAG